MPLTDFQQITYIREIQSQADFAGLAWNSFLDALTVAQNTGAPPEIRERSHREVFRNIHSFLTHTSNLSKLFLPVQSKTVDQDRADRGQELATMFGIPQDGVLASRALRNHLEHFDERLDDWRRAGHRSIVTGTIGPRDSIRGLDPRAEFRSLSSDDMVFRFRGEEYPLIPLRDQVVRILGQCPQLLRERGLHF